MNYEGIRYRLKMNKYHIRTYSITQRKTLVDIKQFAKLPKPSRAFNQFIESFPDILGGKDFKRLIDAIVKSVRNKRLVGVGLGAHVIKCGLSLVIIDLMKKGVIKAIAMHGATAIHDYEISLIGRTSEDVATNIKTGKFGMVSETSEAFVRACRNAVSANIGLGQSLGKLIIKERNKFASASILANAYKLGIPATVHVAIGTDTVHIHPAISGADLGESSLTDFRIFANAICGLNKGVWLNIGSAVILPEVFLKAVSIARNLGHKLDSFTAANLDMIQHYRPRQNVTGRPAPIGINITGHHEIILPLLRMAVLSRL
jgi:deoxyhypusine synthase